MLPLSASDSAELISLLALSLPLVHQRQHCSSAAPYQAAPE